MLYNISDIVKEVKIAIDENVDSTSMEGLPDEDTLKLNEIIKSKILDGARIIETAAPLHLLDSGLAFGESIGWHGQPGYGSGYVHLPDGFMRLVCFQMSDWDYAVNTAIDERDPMYQLQRSRFGTNAQPSYVILDSEGKQLAPGRGYDEDVAAFVKFLKR